MIPPKRVVARRTPRQERARQTVEAVLDAVPRVARRHGTSAITTNRIAEAAGVSIGSLYQYFPDKQSIYVALHDRHVAGVRRVIERALLDCADAPLGVFTTELVDQLADLHAAEADVHALLTAAAPADGFRRALHATFARVMAPSVLRDAPAAAPAHMVEVLPPLVEALVHGVAQPEAAARGRAKDDALRTVAAYLDVARTEARTRTTRSAAP